MAAQAKWACRMQAGHAPEAALFAPCGKPFWPARRF
jgi:hypothetical protein